MSNYSFGEILMGATTIIAFVALMTVLGEQDYQDALREERNTCLMVAQGHWPVETAEGYRCPEQVAGANHE
jgi:hypothetical protein